MLFSDTWRRKAVKIKEGFTLRPFADQWVAIPDRQTQMPRGTVVAFNEVGCFLWKLMQKECSVEELTEQVLVNYEVTEEKAREDVLRFVEQLREENLLEQ